MAKKIFISKKGLLFIILTLCSITVTVVIFKQNFFLEILSSQLDKVPQSKNIFLTSNGFSPSKIKINEGDTVTFFNETDNAFWPASNFHPSHSLYSDFDPKKPIDAGASWSFTFTKPGEWKFHDHLSPYFEGEIVVGEVNQKNEIAGICEENPQQKECWRKILLSLLAQKGLEKTLVEVSKLYREEPLFTEHCHGLTHDIGLRSYELYLKDPLLILSPLSTFCANGFYHGFMEAFLTATRDLQKSRDFCTFIGKNLGTEAPDVELQCYHGIGHGALELGLSANKTPKGKFTEQELLDPALNICQKVSTSPEQLYRCSSGAFNGIANFYLQKEFGLIPRQNDPLWICRNYPKNFKESCYGNMNALLSGMTKNDFSKSVNFIENMDEDSYAIASMRYLASTPVATKVRTDPEHAINTCRGVEKRLYVACFEGLAHSFLEHGQPTEEDREALSFCRRKELNSFEKEICFRYILSNLAGWFSPQKTERICRETENKYQHYCQNKINRQ